ncbi:MAG: S8 family peptidase [Thermodesulfobacteriota bacterium]
MKSRYCIVIVTIGLLLSIKHTEANSTNMQSVMANCNRPFFPGELLVKFKARTSLKATQSIHFHLGVSRVREGYQNCHQIIEVPPGKEKEMAKAYYKRPEVAYAEPNYYRSIYATPNDELYPFQWNFPLINLEEAWDISTGEGVTVAVLDTGVNSFGKDGFGSQSEKRVLRGYNALLGLPGAARDYLGHGTHVAGIIAQETNNVTGAAGIAYNAKILPVKVLLFTGEGLDSWIINGIRWVTDHGADIINLSIGGAPPSQALEDAINYAYQQGVVLVASSGNDAEGVVDYPAAFENCIAVGAVRYDKNLAAHYSNYGDALDLVAPGGDMREDQNGDGEPDGIRQEGFERFLLLGIKWGYPYFTGTSFSSPHVAGVAALVKSLHPEYGPDEIRQVLQETAEDLGETGWDETYGYGLVDANAAVSY